MKKECALGLNFPTGEKKVFLVGTDFDVFGLFYVMTSDGGASICVASPHTDSFGAKSANASYLTSIPNVAASIYFGFISDIAIEFFIESFVTGRQRNFTISQRELITRNIRATVRCTMTSYV